LCCFPTARSAAYTSVCWPNFRPASNALQAMDKTLIHCPSEHGHYGTYVKYLLDYVAHAKLDPRKLVFLAPQGFPNKRGDVVDQAKTLGVQLEYYAPLRTKYSGVNTLMAPLKDWNAAHEHAKLCHAERVVFLNGDAIAQMRIPATRRLLFRVSGVLYRPFPHYHTFATTQLTTALELKRLRQQLLLARACRHPELEALYWLDPYGAQYMNTKTTPKNVWLPDPVELDDNRNAAVLGSDIEGIRRTLGVPPNGRLWLVFGADIVRKGTREILRALPTHDAASDVTIALVGAVYPGQEAPLDQAVSAAQREFPGRIVVHKHFLPEADVAKYFSAASLVLTLYHHHMGSSGAFMRAAAAGKPVLSTDFGLLGHLTHTHKLGFTCNVHQEAAMRNLLRLAASGAVERAFDPAPARAFAQQHGKLEFAKRILTPGA
jgi:glycosyltransferase involved in cell wall biosynthesis